MAGHQRQNDAYTQEKATTVEPYKNTISTYFIKGEGISSHNSLKLY